MVALFVAWRALCVGGCLWGAVSVPSAGVSLLCYAAAVSGIADTFRILVERRRA